MEVLTWRGLKTYYVLFFLHLETRRVTIAGITRHPTEQWMTQMARHAVDDIDGAFRTIRFALHDRDSKFCASFRATLRSGGVRPLLLPARSPNLDAFAERWVRSIKSECLSQLILFGESSLCRAIAQFLTHYHYERNHQGKANLLLFPAPNERQSHDRSAIRCRERLGGLLKYYHPCCLNFLTLRGHGGFSWIDRSSKIKGIHVPANDEPHKPSLVEVAFRKLQSGAQ